MLRMLSVNHFLGGGGYNKIIKSNIISTLNL